MFSKILGLCLPGLDGSKTFCPATKCPSTQNSLFMGVDGGTFCPGYVFTGYDILSQGKRRSGILLLAPPSQPSHTMSQVTLLVSGGKFASRLDFSGGRCFSFRGAPFFLQGGALFLSGGHFLPVKNARINSE